VQPSEPVAGVQVQADGESEPGAIVEGPVDLFQLPRHLVRAAERLHQMLGHDRQTDMGETAPAQARQGRQVWTPRGGTVEPAGEIEAACQEAKPRLADAG
jgi:hypothetical protein